MSMVEVSKRGRVCTQGWMTTMTWSYEETMRTRVDVDCSCAINNEGFVADASLGIVRAGRDREHDTCRQVSFSSKGAHSITHVTLAMVVTAH